MSEIFFFNEGCEFPDFFSKERVTQWLQLVAEDYALKLGSISFIFCDDEFDYREGKILSGDVFISLDTVQSNALEFGTTYEEELHRVIVHSVLHLIGFKDKSDEDAKEMRSNENHCLELLKTL